MEETDCIELEMTNNKEEEFILLSDCASKSFWAEWREEYFTVGRWTLGTRADTEESRLLELRYLFSSRCNYIPYPGPFAIFQVSFPPNLGLERAEIPSSQLSRAQHKTGTCLPSYRAGASASLLVLCPETCLPLVPHSEHNLNLCSDILSQSAPL